MGRDFKKTRTPDKMSKERRSTLMQKIRSRNTNLETSFIGDLRENIDGDFQTHVRDLRGTPDIVFDGQKVCVFLDSDFWHGWQYPRWKHLLKDDFWRQKIEKNRKRDKVVTQYLRKGGWKVLRYWEHQLKKDKSSIIKGIDETLKRTITPTISFSK